MHNLSDIMHQVLLLLKSGTINIFLAFVPSQQAVDAPPPAEEGDVLHTLNLMDIQPPGWALPGKGLCLLIYSLHSQRLFQF